MPLQKHRFLKPLHYRRHHHHLYPLLLLLLLLYGMPHKHHLVWSELLLGVLADSSSSWPLQPLHWQSHQQSH
jgi:hypothetical protein